MKAIIRVDVPDYQIGQPVSVYFNDTMRTTGICEEDIVRCKDCTFGERAVNGAKERVIQCFNTDLGMTGDCHDPYWFCADGERRK